MSSPKRTADQISGHEDSSETELIGLAKTCRRQEASDAAQEAHSKPFPSYANFGEFLANNLPTNLLPSHVKEALILESNARLDLARREGIDLASISIGEDCLPVWPSFSWDPSAGSLHSAIQARAAASQNAQDLGDLFRNDLISKSNRKLDEVRRQDQSLDEIVIGDGLLPELKGPGQTFESPIVICDDSSDDESEHERKAGSVGIDAPFVSSIESLTDSSDSGSSLSPDVSARASRCTFESTPECPGGLGCSASGFLPLFIENESFRLGLSAPEPFGFFAQNHQPHNIIHNVQMVSDSRAQTVDLEVFVVDGDDDSDSSSSLYNLLGTELVVDRESYEYWNTTDEAIDFEFPNMQVRCTGELFSVEEVDDDQEVSFPHNQGKPLFRPIPIIEEPESPVSADEGAIDVSSPSTIFEEEDGSFRW